MKTLRSFYKRALIVTLSLCAAITVGVPLYRYSLPEPEQCALCELAYRCHAPALMNLATGEILEMRVYEPDPVRPWEPAEEQRTGYFRISNGAGLRGWCDGGIAAHAELREGVAMSDRLFCRKCRLLLAVCQTLDIEDELPYFMSRCKRAGLNMEGQEKLREYRELLVSSKRFRRVEEIADIPYIEMPVSRLAASAGTGSLLDEGTFEQTRVPSSEVPEGAVFGVRVSGDSMEPVYHDGQIAWVQPCDRLHVGEVGIFTYDGEGYIKVYGTQMPEENQREAYTRSDGTLAPQPVLISYNAKYPPRAISADMGFQIVGRVL